MNVLSLFDGMSCGQIAIERAGIKIDNYFASEIDRHAIKVAQYNYPNTVQLGDVTKIKADNLPQIDLLIGGSPCQGFSFAGKQLNFDDPRSSLFFEYVRLLKECKPKYFLLENVRMKKEYQDVITKYLGADPVEINSALVSAQDRKRLYWTNIPCNAPHDKRVYLADVLSDIISDEYFLKDRLSGRFSKIAYIKNKNKSCVIGKLSPYQGDRVFDIDCKASSLSASGGNNGGGGCNLIFDIHNRKLRKLTENECERLQTVPVDYTLPASTKRQRYKMLGNGWTVDVIAHILKGIP